MRANRERGEHGTENAGSCSGPNGEHAVRDFDAWIHCVPEGEALLARARLDLAGRSLACWCKLCPRHRRGKPFDVHCDVCAPCHADVLGAAVASGAA